MPPNTSSNNTVDYDAFTGNHTFEVPDNKDDFIWSLKEEPHYSRRLQIKKKHPEINKLFGHEPMTKWIVLAVMTLQLGTAYYCRDKTWSLEFWVLAYVIGATCTQNLFLAIHECSHQLLFKKRVHNELFGMIMNLPICLPYSTKFKGYHIEHHKLQGVDGIDTDVPTKLEMMLFNNVLGKLFFCTTQILFYACRPMAVRHQIFDQKTFLNFVIQFSFDALVIKYFGWGPIIYLLASGFLAGSLHPVASHFIAEHYVFCGEAETYSYYGPLNIFCYNVGYHNEHHDFPNIPWSRLPQLRDIASEFYDELPYHKSWPRVLWHFIFDSRIGSKNRVKREDTLKLASTTVCGDGKAMSKAPKLD
jgi:sphingolipid 4-desaturase/C4-monooxygenase